MFKEDPVMQKSLFRNLWMGTAIGLLISLAIAAVFLVMWFKYASNLWATSEALWEAIMSMIASVLMTIMSLAFLTSDSLTAKWQRKLQKALVQHKVVETELANPENDASAGYSNERKDSIATEKTLSNPATGSSSTPRRMSLNEITEESNKDSEQIPFAVATRRDSEGQVRYSGETVQTSNKVVRSSGASPFFWIPLVTVLREGLEGMVFLGGIGINESPENIPFAVLAGIAAGLLIGWFIFRAGNSMKLQTFFVSASIFILYLSAGLMSKSIFKFEQNTWNINLGVMDSDMLDYYNVQQNVWHVSCCNPEDKTQGGWQLLNAILGWNNTATIGSVVSYVLFWFLFSAVLVSMKLLERRRVRLGQAKLGFKHCVKTLFSGLRM
ncbi:UNVERIFIED_CONTAM: high-affinity iron permease [Siphonaria sp. JEL0065]|nr:high-affinity iron permease [Siphonaria sp. JEL0065]